MINFTDHVIIVKEIRNRRKVWKNSRLPLDSFSIDTDGDTISAKQQISAEKYYFKEYDLNDGYRCAVCALNPHSEDEIRIVRPKNIK